MERDREKERNEGMKIKKEGKDGREVRKERKEEQ